MSLDAARKVHIGTSGWSYPDWVGPFYPEGTPQKDYLSAYAERFPVVEVDSTFYAIPRASTFQGWAERTPDAFRFALKVPGIVTHGADGERANPEKVLTDTDGNLGVFLERARLLGPKLAQILFQFPYFRVKEMEKGDLLARLAATLSALPGDVRCAVEIRNKGWIGPDLLGLLEQNRAAAVLIDHLYMPGPLEQVALGMVTTDFAYVRLLGDRHGIEKKTKTWGAIVEEKGERLGKWGSAILEIAARPSVQGVYAFSNNHFAGHAPETCLMLARCLEGGAMRGGGA